MGIDNLPFRKTPVLAAFALLSSCQCLQPVADCAGKPCPEPAPDCGGRPCDPIEQLLIDATIANSCDWDKACGYAAPEVSCDDLLWGKRYLGPEFARILEEEIDAGTIAFDLSAGQRCVDAIKSGCGDRGCWPPWVGTVKQGDACRLSQECAPGLYCARGNVCPATCVPTLDAGAEPDDSADEACGRLLVQFLSDGGYRCYAPVATGVSCAPLADEMPSYPRACAAGLSCVTHDGGMTCGPGLTSGQPCVGFGDCSIGLICSGVPRVCSPPAHLGERCGDPWPRCLEGYSCSATQGVCVAPSSQSGDPCFSLETDCAPPLGCPGPSVQSTCQHLSAVGEACSSASDCGDFRVGCVLGLCQSYQPVGATCAATSDCEWGIGCTQGLCSDLHCH